MKDMNQPIILKEAFDNFAKYQECGNCPLKLQCSASIDILDSASICDIITGNYEGFDEYYDEHKEDLEN